MAKRPGSSNTLRIIGGVHGGRKLHFPDAPGLRPTADRIRETLFNWVQNEINGSRCLDLFAGSGALGFEAASRGAKQVVMVDLSRTVVKQLNDNTRLLNLQQVIKVFQGKAASWIEQHAGQQFDLVFLDPPFADGLLQNTFEQLMRNNMLAKQAQLYVERQVDQKLPDLPAGCSVSRDKKAGQVAYTLIQCSS